MKEMLTYLYGLERRGIKVGLDHTEKLLEIVGNPHTRFPSIHVFETSIFYHFRWFFRVFISQNS